MKPLSLGVDIEQILELCRTYALNPFGQDLNSPPPIQVQYVHEPQPMLVIHLDILYVCRLLLLVGK